ncbi:hypothetical protein HMPREF9225_0677 [Peptoniphilus duerdenii ATCC BAA-1640]|uniref:Uncharacterized protein n=1 Tax=Peptoniphilus duerdenii ATCC BAA-1640 TaxID=862517 RepID=E0NKI8_9FIRM|nr:hypothetical protein HMPREF9225_0677 [Peptoniphilus duerdenii ATCC BAA-1640]
MCFFCFLYIIHLPKLGPMKLDPFDFDGRAVFAQGDCSWEDILFKIPEEDSHTERRVEVYPPPVVEWV